MNHPPTYVRTFSLHKVRENCHFLDHPPTPMSLRNIKMAPKCEQYSLYLFTFLIPRDFWLLMTKNLFQKVNRSDKFLLQVKSSNEKNFLLQLVWSGWRLLVDSDFFWTFFFRMGKIWWKFSGSEFSWSVQIIMRHSI